MRLYYNPSYSGFVYANLHEKRLMFDEKIVSTQGLIDVIKLHAGIHFERKNQNERFVNYYAAMKKYMSLNPNNVLAKSFSVDAFNVAAKCLRWRDQLSLCGWNEHTAAPSERIIVLCGTEKYFTDKSLGEEIFEVTK